MIARCYIVCTVQFISLLKSRPGVQHHITHIYIYIHTAIKYTKPFYTEL